MALDAPYREAGHQLAAPIQAIRIAQTLTEQFGALTAKTQFRTVEALEIVLAEARHIYPAMWSHLDAARGALRKAGIPVDGYDDMRGTAAAEGGVLEVTTMSESERVAALFVGGGRKSAQLNLRGHAVATRACALLRSALPQVDWDAFAKEDALLAEAARSLRPALWKRVVMSALFGVFVLVTGAVYLAYRFHFGL